jgi:hypothetical protein
MVTSALHLDQILRSGQGRRQVYRSVFSLGGVVNPAYDPHRLLIRAGDVEENPGPSERTDCSVCGRRLRGDNGRLVCVTEGCKTATHKQKACSGLTRAGQMAARWRCGRCTAVTGQTQTRTLAGRPIQTTAGPAQHPRGKVPCLMCGKTVPAVACPLVCSICRRHCHKSCAAMTRAEIDMHLAAQSWKCTECRNQQQAPPASQPNTLPERRRKAKAVDRDSLRILQWNCNGLRTSSLELENLLEAWKADVCIIQ